MLNKYFIQFRFIVFIVILIGTASCGTIQKRTYNRGYAVNWFQGSHSSAIEVTSTHYKSPEKVELEETEKQLENDVQNPLELTNEKLGLNDAASISPVKTELNQATTRTLEKTLEFEIKNHKLVFQKENPWVDSTNKSNNPVDPKKLPKEPIGEWAFWLIMGSIFIAAMVVLLSLITTSGILLEVLNVIFLLALIAFSVGLILGKTSLGIYKHEPGVYRGRGKVRAAVIAAKVIVGICLLLFVLGLILIGLMYL